MADIRPVPSPEMTELESQLGALGDWRALLDQELADMAETSRRIEKLARRA